MGNFMREIRILNTSGVAGYVFTKGEGVIIPDAYADPRFNRNIDEQTGFVTAISSVCQSRPPEAKLWRSRRFSTKKGPI